ncbi:dockerin type I domain-containing protein [Rubripirellula amarantea]|nr:dockerin type I domain-containing protein [Rubripirellula amarantea]
MAADSIGVTPTDNGEFLVGRVAVTPVLFESDGSIDQQSQNWTTDEIAETLAKVTEGLQWWTDTLDSLNTVHSLEFVIDDTFAANPVDTAYEPIDRNTSALNLYVGDFLTDQGYGDAGTVEQAVALLNNDQRIKHDADWAFTIFIVDSSDDPDGLFAAGGSFAAAFAYPGGLFIVTPSTRPASTIAHEMGHIFWARDEYSGGGSWTDQRGYYNTQNLNAADNPTTGFVQEISIMRGGVPLTAAFENHVSPASTLAMVGWQDSDGDGIFDFADVPLQLDGIGSFNSETSLYRFAGSASAVPLQNRNSSGNQSDITLNEISQLQYRLDGGDWLTAATVGAQSADLDVEFSIGEAFETIELRVIDDSVGVTSELVSGTNLLPAIAGSSISGIAFLDQNGDGQRSDDEPLLANHLVTVRQADGSALFETEIVADAFDDDGELPSDAALGMTLSADGIVASSMIGVFESESVSGRVFHSYDLQRERWSERFDDRVALVANFHLDTVPVSVGEVSVTAGGLDQGSYARIEGYDGDGNLVARATSSLIDDGQSETITLTDVLGRIEQIRVFGHADTSIVVSEIVAGVSGELQTDSLGVWRLNYLPLGDYQIEVTPQVITQSFDSVPQVVSVTAEASSVLMAGAVRVDSPRHNLISAEDVNDDGKITSLDALLIINDMSRSTSRVLGLHETEGFYIDVNNDGSVTALDALLVINSIGRSESGEPERIAQSESQLGTGTGTGTGTKPSQSFYSADSSIPSKPGVSSPFVDPVPEVTSDANDLVFTKWGTDLSDRTDLAGRETTDESAGRVATDSTPMPLVSLEKVDRSDLEARNLSLIRRPTLNDDPIAKPIHPNSITEMAEITAELVDPFGEPFWRWLV